MTLILSCKDYGYEYASKSDNKSLVVEKFQKHKVNEIEYSNEALMQSLIRKRG
jgi:hypothetical protein